MSILGAIVHSIPIAVHYGSMATTRIYFGAADGMMHSIKQDGTEAWGYLPSPILPKISFITDDTAGLKFESTVDGPMAFMHFEGGSPNGIVNPGEKAYIIFGYRRGAHAYTVIDVSDPDTPVLKQHIYTDGESWGKPLLFTRGGTQYMAITGGYDPCFDADIPSCGSPVGNRIDIYRWNGATEQFVSVKTYNKLTSPSGIVQNADWLTVPFSADGVAVNITEEDTTDADFIYFVDISGSVFRIDTRSSNINAWTFRLAFRNRPDPVIPSALWRAGFRSYYSFVTFPPQKQYITGSSDAGVTMSMPIPVATGNAVNTSLTGEPNKVFVFYDPIDPVFASGDTSIEFADLKTLLSLTAHAGENFIAGKNGWIWMLDDSPSRKVITNPMMFYDEGDADMWILMWTVFAPSSFGECKSAGNSYAYFRMIANGSDLPADGKWEYLAGNASFDFGGDAPPSGGYDTGGDEDTINDADALIPPSETYTSSGEGRATGISLLGSSQTGYLPVAGSGDDMKGVQGFELLISAPASILKWYELY